MTWPPFLYFLSPVRDFPKSILMTSLDTSPETGVTDSWKPLQMLGTKLGAFAWPQSTFNDWVISLASPTQFSFEVNLSLYSKFSYSSRLATISLCLSSTGVTVESPRLASYVVLSLAWQLLYQLSCLSSPVSSIPYLLFLPTLWSSAVFAPELP